MPRPERGETMVRLDGVTKIYTKGGVELVVLDRLDLDVKAGSFVALMGPSGSGKSTILNLVGGLDIPDEGSVTVGGVDVATVVVVPLTTTKSGATVHEVTAGEVRYSCVVELDNSISSFEAL